MDQDEMLANPFVPPADAGGTDLLSLILPLDRVDLADAFAVPIFGEIGCEPGLYDLAHLLVGDRFATKGQDIRAVMFTRVARHFYRIACRRAHAWNFVGGHCRADARAVDHNAYFSGSIGNCPGDGVSEVRIVDGAFRVRAEVMNAMTQSGEKTF